MKRHDISISLLGYDMITTHLVQMTSPSGRRHHSIHARGDFSGLVCSVCFFILRQPLIDWATVLRPIRHKTGHFGDVLQSQSQYQRNLTEHNESKHHNQNKAKVEKEKANKMLNQNLKTNSQLQELLTCVHITVHNCRIQHSYSTVLIIFTSLSPDNHTDDGDW